MVFVDEMTILLIGLIDSIPLHKTVFSFYLIVYRLILSIENNG
jgi:hypothetical protein